MCTAVISFRPEASCPVLLAGVRDELLARPWEPPARHWPELPRVVGGRDVLAGGTWLAVDPEVPRVGCVLNGRGAMAPEESRISRGELPLRAASTGKLTGVELPRLDPFHLLCADLDGVRLWSWDGVELVDRWLEPGLHVVVNSGLEGSGAGQDELGGPEMAARVAHFHPRFAAVPRPSPLGDAGSTMTPAEAWGDWLGLADGDALTTADPRALILRHELPEGPVYGTSSVSLVALAATGVRYDFAPNPGPDATWGRVL